MDTPLSLHNQGAPGILEIAWSDGSRQRLPHLLLRQRCQCADCKRARQEGLAELAVDAAVRVTGIRPVGSYGAQLLFSDGHERGIFPWIFLKTLQGAASPDLSGPSRQAG